MYPTSESDGGVGAKPGKDGAPGNGPAAVVVTGGACGGRWAPGAVRKVKEEDEEAVESILPTSALASSAVETAAAAAAALLLGCLDESSICRCS